MSKATILMIEDNADILCANAAALRMEEYCVLEADTLEAGRALAQQEVPDLILLDILLPDGSGLDYCRELFGQNAPRILFLSALHTPKDVIAGLRAGGDDYMTKPYLMDELVARVEALLRRPVSFHQQQEESVLRIGPLELDTLCSRAYLNGIDLLLTPKEAALLGFLLHSPGEYIPRQQLYKQIWGMEAVDTRPVKQHIRRLREKLGSSAPVVIDSEQGKGYRIVELAAKGGQNVALDK